MIPEFLRHKFLTGLTRRVGELQSALAARDRDKLAIQFHSLAGIGGTYGFAEVTQLARKAERLAQRGRFDAIEPIVRRLAEVPAASALVL